MTRQRAVAAAIAAALGVVLVALVIALPMIMVRLRPPETRTPGQWRFTHQVDSARWPVTERILDQTHEYTIVTDSAGSTCVVATSQTTLAVDPTADSHPVRVGLRSATYVDDRDASPEIVWSYAAGSTAEVRCSADTIEQTLLELARQVRFADSRVQLPFMISSLPAGYHVATVNQRRAGAEVAVTLTPQADLALPSVIISYGGDQPSDRCLATTAYPVCLTTSWSAEELPSAAARERRSVAAVEQRLRVVADPGDRATWFDAIDLPH